MKKIGILSAGTDNPGINSVIRAITRVSCTKGCEVFGIQFGFKGLVDDCIIRLTNRTVSGKIGEPGSFLGSSKPRIINTPEKMQRALDNLNKRSIDDLIVIGGSGTFEASLPFIEKGKHVIGVPSTVQDDICGTDISLGVDSCVNTIMNCIDHIRSCDSSRNRSFLVEVCGRDCGNVALRSAIVSGCEFVLTPENPCDKPGQIEELAKKIEKTTNSGKTQCICVISSGWKPGTKALIKALSDMGEHDLSIRETILGHLQRGGQPTAYDRLLGARLGAAAAKAIIDGHSGEFVGLKGNDLALVPFSETIGKIPQLQRIEDIFNSTNIL